MKVAIFFLYIVLLILIPQFFAIDNILTSYISQVMYWAVSFLLAFMLVIERKQEKFFLFYVMSYIIMISSWHIMFFKYPLSPDVVYENQIVSNIISTGFIGSPSEYYYASRLYSEFPLLEVLTTSLTLMYGIDSLVILKYLWIAVKACLIVTSLILFKEIFAKEFENIEKMELSWLAWFWVLMFLASSSSIYFFSFSVHSLFATLFVILYFHSIYKRNILSAIISCIALAFSHNATLYIFALALLLWLIIVTITSLFKDVTDSILRRFPQLIALASLTILTVIILWSAQMNFNTIVTRLIQSLVFPEELYSEKIVGAAISPIKPLIYKILGTLGEIILLIIFAINITYFFKKVINSLITGTVLSLITFYSLLYIIGSSVSILVLGTGADQVVRFIFYLNFIIPLPICISMMRWKNLSKKLNFVSFILVLLFLLTGIYGIVPPAVYDKTISWSMDDPRFFLRYGNSLWSVGDYILKYKQGHPIISIALGYYYLGGRGIPFTSLCKIGMQHASLILLRRSIENVSDYCGITLNLKALYSEHSILYDSGEIFLVLKY